MGLGILEDRHLEHVPGTTIFSDDPNATALSVYNGFDLSKLKHGKGRNVHIILVPQPSDDPNDPLNWSKWKKLVILLVLVYGTALAGALGPLVAAGQVEIAIELNRSNAAISRAFATITSLAMGAGTVFWSVMAVKIGKRPVYLLSTLIALAGYIMSGFTSSYNMLLGSRILQGVGACAIQFLFGASIADIFFTHERGVPVALWTLAGLGGTNITPPISGPIIANLGWRWCFRILAVACALLFVLQFFFLPETAYQRNVVLPSDVQPDSSTDSNTDEKKVDIETVSRVGSGAEPEVAASPRRKSFVEELRVFYGINRSSPSWWRLVIRPFVVCLTPVGIWANILFGCAVTWLVSIATSVAQIFSAPPYNFTPTSIGLTYISPFIFSIIGASICGPLSDYAAKRMSKANGGIYEPEFRLVNVIFYAIFGTMGFFGWGLSANAQDPWIGPVIFFGLINLGIIIGNAAAISYVIDAHRQSAESALGGIFVVRAILTVIITFFINDWISARGILNVFGIIGGASLFTCILTIPMYIYGKRTRSFIQRKIHMNEDETSVVAH